MDRCGDDPQRASPGEPQAPNLCYSVPEWQGSLDGDLGVLHQLREPGRLCRDLRAHLVGRVAHRLRTDLGEPPDARLVARRIAANRRLICASPAYLRQHGRPETPPDLARHSCLVLRQNDAAYGLWQFKRGRQQHSVKVRGPLASNDGEVVLSWALEGHGIAMRAEWDLARYLRSGRLELLLEDWATPPADIYALYPQRHHLSARVREFVDFLARRFGAGEGSGKAGRGVRW